MTGTKRNNAYNIIINESNQIDKQRCRHAMCWHVCGRPSVFLRSIVGAHYAQCAASAKLKPLVRMILLADRRAICQLKVSVHHFVKGFDADPFQTL